MNLDSSNAFAIRTFSSGQNSVDIEFDAGINRLGALGNDLAISFTKANRQGQGPLVTFGGPNNDQIAVTLDTAGTTAQQLADAINNNPMNVGIIETAVVGGSPDTNISDTLVTYVQLSLGSDASTAQDVIDAINAAAIPVGQPNAGQVVQATLASGSGNTVVALDDPGKAYADVPLAIPASSSELGLSDDAFDTITAGTLQIGDLNSGPITISANITRPAATNVNLTSGGAISFAGGSIDTGSGNLMLAPGTGGVSFAHAGVDTNLGATGTLSFASGANLVMPIGGPTVDTQYDQLHAIGNVDLTGVNLVPALGFQPALGDQFTVINNMGDGATIGQFSNFSNQKLAVKTASYSALFAVNYRGGDGNDVVVTALNISPTLDPIPDPSPIDEDASLQSIGLTGLSAGHDGTAILNVTAVSSNPSLIPDPDVQFSADAGTGTLTYTPLSDQFGTAIITVTVQDDGGTDSGGVDSVTQTFAVTVKSVNDPPSFDQVAGNYSAKDENPLTHGPALSQSIAGWATNMSAGPANEGSQKLTFSVTCDNKLLFAVQPAVGADGTLSYTPKPNAHGIANVTVVLQDDGGGNNKSQAATFQIEIAKPFPLHNTLNAFDVTGAHSPAPDGFIVAGDVLFVINYINARGSGPIPANTPPGPPYPDVVADNDIAANDVLAIINWINAHSGQSEAEADPVNPQVANNLPSDLISLLSLDIAEQAGRRRRVQ
jgi:hypothetical protein